MNYQLPFFFILWQKQAFIMRVIKQWQNSNFWVNNTFKLVQKYQRALHCPISVYPEWETTVPFSATLLIWTCWKNTQKNSPRFGFKSLDLVSEQTYRDSWFLGSVCTCVAVINHTNWYWLLSQNGRPVSGSPESESVTFSVTSCCALSKALNHHEGLLAAFSLSPPSVRN